MSKANRAFNKAVAKALGKEVKDNRSVSKLKKILWKEISLYVRLSSDRCLNCGRPTQCACHIVPSNDSAMTRFFLPNIYPGCFGCNESERRFRGRWVYIHKTIFGSEYVDALYELSRVFFQIKRGWLLEQIDRVRKLRLQLESHTP